VIGTVGSMARANAEIRAAQQHHEEEKANRLRLGRPIVFIDGLINELEILKLKGGLRVPTAYETRLLQLRVLLADRAVPSAVLEKLRTRILVVNLMDQLYAIQESLFTHRRPDIWEETDRWNPQRGASHDAVYGLLSAYQVEDSSRARA
jgi:hypothetical protein